MSDISSFIHGMPKAELHLHIEGTLEPELRFELAARNGVSLPYGSAAEMRAAYAFQDLTSFLAAYYEGISVLRAERDFYDLAMAYFRKASAQRVVYAEVFFDPQAHTRRCVPFGTVIDGLHRARLDAEANLGLRAQLIMCFLRDMPAVSAMQTPEQSLPYRDRIIGVGLDSELTWDRRSAARWYRAPRPQKPQPPAPPRPCCAARAPSAWPWGRQVGGEWTPLAPRPLLDDQI